MVWRPLANDLALREVRLVSIALALVATAEMVVVVATAPTSYPTPSDNWWGHAMPTHEGDIDLFLIAVSALLFGIAAATTFRHRLVAGLSVCFTSACILYVLSIITWRLHSPVSSSGGG